MIMLWYMAAIPSAEITLPVICIMTRGKAGSQVTLCGEWYGRVSICLLFLSYCFNIHQDWIVYRIMSLWHISRSKCRCYIRTFISLPILASSSCEINIVNSFFFFAYHNYISCQGKYDFCHCYYFRNNNLILTFNTTSDSHEDIFPVVTFTSIISSSSSISVCTDHVLHLHGQFS